MRPAWLAHGARRLLATALVIASVGGPSPLSHQSLSSSPRVDGDQLISDVHVLAAPEMEGRRTGTSGSRRAQAFITERFEQLGLEPVGGSYTHTFPVGSHRWNSATHGVNLLGIIPGRREPDRFVLISAHYDHIGVRGGVTYRGADDNASGVAGMLAIAGWFARNQPDQSLVFIAFDAEEQGLAGSRRFVADSPIDLRRVRVVVNLDMIGRGDDNILVAAGTRHSPALAPVVSAAAAGRELTVRFGHDRPASEAPGEADWTHSSDHGPFHAAGVPFLYFGVADHRDYHRPTDTADRIPRRFFVEATEVILETVRRLAGPEAPVGQ
jgi:Zn-dependent M28 family amino/carboxypeptidase